MKIYTYPPHFNSSHAHGFGNKRNAACLVKPAIQYTLLHSKSPPFYSRTISLSKFSIFEVTLLARCHQTASELTRPVSECSLATNNERWNRRTLLKHCSSFCGHKKPDEPNNGPVMCWGRWETAELFVWAENTIVMVWLEKMVAYTLVYFVAEYFFLDGNIRSQNLKILTRVIWARKEGHGGQLARLGVFLPQSHVSHTLLNGVDCQHFPCI